jgi:sugar phosphate isomerase/epimerase
MGTKNAIVAPSYVDERRQGAFLRDLEAWMGRVSELGYDGVELDVCDPGQLDVDGLVRLAFRFDLEIPAIGTGRAWLEDGLSFSDPDPETRRAAVRRFEAHVPVAAELGAILVIGLLRGTVPLSIEPGRAIMWVIEALKECAEIAMRREIRIAFEMVNRYESALVNTAAEGMNLLSRVNAENVGLLLDTFHMNIEEPDICDSIRQGAPALFHFHVADSNRHYPGGGHLDFVSIVATLHEVGYEGIVSVEALPIPSAEICAERSMAAIRSWSVVA